MASKPSWSIPRVRNAAEKDLRGIHNFAQDYAGNLFIHQDGIYRPGGAEALNRWTKDWVAKTFALTGHYWAEEDSKHMIAAVKADTPELWARPPIDRVCLLGGILNLSDPAHPEMEPHSPAFLSTNQLPVHWDPKSRCPAWDAFIESVFPEDSRWFPYRMSAWLMRPDLRIQKSVIFPGQGSTGKTTFLACLGAFMGDANYESVPLHRMETNRFKTAHLMYKLVNICDDDPNERLENSGVFKALTGNSWLDCEFKFGRSFKYRPYCRLVFSSNKLPVSKDASDAFFRRWMVLHLTNSFTGTPVASVESWVDKLSSPEELSGVLNRAVAELPALDRDGLGESVSLQAGMRDMLSSTDPFLRWIRDRVDRHEPARTLLKDAVFEDYCAFFRPHAPACNSRAIFFKTLKRYAPEIQFRQNRIGGRVRETVAGIGLRFGEGG